MLETRLKMGTWRKLCRPMLALGLACAFGGFVAVGCVDNSGNKTYPRGDSGAADSGEDVSIAEDAGTEDAKTTSDAPASDTPASDAQAAGDIGVDLSPPVDAGGLDVRLDSGTAG
jgi:hypothetical protein